MSSPRSASPHLAPAPGELARLIAGAHHDPHAVLGAHEYGDHTVIRTLRPHAESVVALVGARRFPMTHVSAGLFAVASLVTFALLRERALPQATPGAAGHAASSGVTAALAQLGRTWRQARRDRDFTALLACAVAYQAGISVVVALAAIYAEQALGFKQTDTMMLIFLVNIAAAAGAFAWGYVQDRIGHQRAIAVTLVGWIVMTVLAGLATTATLFWGAAVIAGLCMGSSQSAGRALAGALAPEHQRAEFFGLWTFAIRLSAIIGPVTYGLITLLSAGNHRLAIFSTGLFFVLGLVLLRAVDVRRGIAAAQGAVMPVDERDHAAAG